MYFHVDINSEEILSISADERATQCYFCNDWTKERLKCDNRFGAVVNLSATNIRIEFLFNFPPNTVRRAVIFLGLAIALVLFALILYNLSA